MLALPVNKVYIYIVIDLDRKINLEKKILSLFFPIGSIAFSVNAMHFAFLLKTQVVKHILGALGWTGGGGGGGGERTCVSMHAAEERAHAYA